MKVICASWGRGFQAVLSSSFPNLNKQTTFLQLWVSSFYIIAVTSEYFVPLGNYSTSSTKMGRFF